MIAGDQGPGARSQILSSGYASGEGSGVSCHLSPVTCHLSSLGVTIARLVTDSREVRAGDTFVACPGSRVDGRQFIAQAIAGGASAVIWEERGFLWNKAWQVPNLAVADLRHHAGEIADQVYGSPSKKLWMVGVTGTNGKTSCSHWIAQTFSALNKKTALLGTLGNGFPGALQPALNTTPDAIRLHGLLADYLAQGARAAAMEVSSHALEQGRVNGVKYDVALLTHLSRDHLDYHGSMSSYAAAKRRLFGWQQLGHAVLNLDDAFGAELAEQLQDAGPEVIAYGLTPAALAAAERLGLRMVYGAALRMGEQSGFTLQIRSSWGGGTLHSALVGRFNAANLLGVLAVLLASGVALADALRELAQVRPVRGRMETFGGGDRPAVVVDYAHTPDALEKVLLSLREVAQARGGKLICVFGCGGDRDTGKRPMMGVIADRLADACFVTSDNPRGESPRDIIAAIESGMSGAQRSIENRAEAIARAIGGARAADTVLVAGKGHEDYQEINGVKMPFSDAEAVQRALGLWRPQA
ncbi:MAG: UDP-N-acetylmuramoyl-L-alanyl-D-glutamate--2,6-diaminopimelate ligase [Nitrosomonadales bacterium]|nr:UDP-N-acetylmuramoyl-L-alanyl-D-glutamate--2,6-diaminopimelate ligase [Nitrosomonadales bacterium]